MKSAQCHHESSNVCRKTEVKYVDGLLKQAASVDIISRHMESKVKSILYFLLTKKRRGSDLQSNI